MWTVTTVLLSLFALAGIVYRGLTSADGPCYRFVQYFYLSFGSLERYQRRGSGGVSLVDLVTTQDTSWLQRVVAKIAASEVGWFAPSYPTDKGDWHDYLRIYDAVFAPYRGRDDLRVLEVGVKKGGSIALWRDYFAPDARIYGIDVNRSVPMFTRDGHIKILIVDSRDAAAVHAALGGTTFDIILDDGLHEPEDQWMTFQALSPHLKPTGIYVAEDVLRPDDARFEDCGFESSTIPDKSGQFVRIILPPQSLARHVDLSALAPSETT